MKPIPIGAARNIAEKYGYHQVIIIARATGDGGNEHVTTYGTDKEHCRIAAMVGRYIKLKIMHWKPDAESIAYKKLYEALKDLLADANNLENASQWEDHKQAATIALVDGYKREVSDI